LLPLMTLWANLHGSFLFGLLLILPFGLEALLFSPGNRVRAGIGWGAVFGGSLFATLLNPHGFSGLIFPVILSTSGLESLIPEWKAVNFTSVGPIEVSLIAGLVVVLLLGVRVSLIRLILLAGMVHLTLAHQRFVMVLAIVGAMILAEPLATALKAAGVFNEERGPRAPLFINGVSAASFALVGAFGLLYPHPLKDSEITPVSALNAVPAEVRSLPVFNDWIQAGYMIFAGTRAFIDGRAELYGTDFIRNYLRIDAGDPEALAATFKRYKIAWTLLSPSSGAARILDESAEWCRAYADRYAVVHVRRDVSPCKFEPGPPHAEVGILQ
jgi:hypothetical protein